MSSDSEVEGKGKSEIELYKQSKSSQIILNMETCKILDYDTIKSFKSIIIAGISSRENCQVFVYIFVK